MRDSSLRRLRASEPRAEIPSAVEGPVMAESEGFEPPIPVKVCRFSRPVPSTAPPTLRGVGGFTSDYYNTEMRQQKSPLVLLRCRRPALPPTLTLRPSQCF